MLISQGLVSPISLFLFYSIMPQMQGGTFADSIQQIRVKFWSTLQTSWSYWPVVQLINFVFVPQRYQAYFVNAFALAFNIYMSYMTFVYHRVKV